MLDILVLIWYYLSIRNPTQYKEGANMKTTITLTDRNGVTRNYRINNNEFYSDMIKNADTPEAAAVWLALGEAAGHLVRV